MGSKGISRRKFFKLIGGAGLFGTGILASGCSGKTAGGKGWMPTQYEGKGAWPAQVKGRIAIADDNPSIARDDAKCILCGQCIEVCKNVMSVYGSYELPLKKEIPCVNCGQCTLWCPTGAITEKYELSEVEKALEDPEKFVLVQTAPATKVALGEEFGLSPGSIVEKKQVAALKALGFDAVLDTCFSADLTIMEEAAEVLHRLKGPQKALPQFTSCCPGWVKFCEYYYPALLGHLSSCKSPQQMLGAVAKTYYAKAKGISAEKIVSVAIMPCTAKKAEARRTEMNAGGKENGRPQMMDVDYVLTTRELARLLKKKQINVLQLQGQEYDSLLGESTGAGKIFGATGGVTEAAVRTLYYYVTKQNPPDALLNWQAVRGLQGVKEAEASVPGFGAIKVAVCHGLKNAREILRRIEQGDRSWQFIEFMACPGGCIGGGGQPKSAVPPTDDIRKARIDSLYQLDAEKSEKRLSYENGEIQRIYQEFLGEPLSERAEHLLHTEYEDKSGLLTAGGKNGRADGYYVD